MPTLTRRRVFSLTAGVAAALEALEIDVPFLPITDTNETADCVDVSGANLKFEQSFRRRI